MTSLQLEIVSPLGSLFKGQCAMAVVPSVSGEIGVMFGHEAFTAQLQEGKITIFDEKNNIIKEVEITSAGGFAQIESGEKLLVLVN